MCYSDPNEEPYKKAAAFLDNGGLVEDWGCGTGWAKRYFSEYRGLDGAPSSYVKAADVVDLVHHVSNPLVPNILCKHALEYNIEWLQIFDNIKRSFTRRFCLITSTPEAEVTHIDNYQPIRYADGSVSDQAIPEFFFNRQDIRDQFPLDTYWITEETITTDHLYGSDWILYVERV